VATQILTPTLVPAAEATTVTNLVNLTTPTTITPGNTVQFANVPGQTILYIAVQATGGTIQLNVGSTIFGQSFAAFSTIALTASNNYILGAFHSALDVQGQTYVTLVTSGALTSEMTVLQLAGVF
jgi:hypothetical protein